MGRGAWGDGRRATGDGRPTTAAGEGAGVTPSNGLEDFRLGEADGHTYIYVFTSAWHTGTSMCASTSAAYIYVYTWTKTCAYACIHVCIYISAWAWQTGTSATYLYVYTWTQACACACIHVYICLRLGVADGDERQAVGAVQPCRDRRRLGEGGDRRAVPVHGGLGGGQVEERGLACMYVYT